MQRFQVWALPVRAGSWQVVGSSGVGLWVWFEVVLGSEGMGVWDLGCSVSVGFRFSYFGLGRAKASDNAFLSSCFVAAWAPKAAAMAMAPEMPVPATRQITVS